MRRTKEETEQTRTDIMDAAIKVFSKKGVSATTLGEIAQEAGVTRGAIYWHFKNKAEIFDALCEDLHAELAEDISKDFSQPHPQPMAQLQELCIRLLQDLEGDARVQQILALFLSSHNYEGDMAPYRDKHVARRLEKVDLFRQYFVRAKDGGTLPKNADPDLLALSVVCYMKGIVTEFMQSPDHFSLDKQAPQLVRLFFKGLIEQSSQRSEE